MQACKQQEGRTTHEKHNQEFKTKNKDQEQKDIISSNKTREQNARTIMNNKNKNEEQHQKQKNKFKHQEQHQAVTKNNIDKMI